MTYPQGNLAGDVPVLGPIGVAVATLGAAAVQVIGADPVRRGIIFHNPGDNNVRLTTADQTPVRGGAGYLLYPQNELTIYGDQEAGIHVNAAWKAVTDDGSAQPLTIFNFTDSPNPDQAMAPQPVARLTTSIPIVSPKATLASVGAASAQIVAANQNRRGIIFSNGSDVDIWVTPANLTAIAGAGSMRIFPASEKRIMATGRIRVNCAWKAIAASGSGKSLTILEFV